MSRSQEDALEVFQLLHPSMRWRLFIDGYRQDEGPDAFDKKEPGYMRAMDNAYVHLLDSFDEPLSSAVIEQLHVEALSTVDNTDNEHTGEFRHDSPGDFGLRAAEESGIPVMAGNVTLAGLQEFMASGVQHEVAVSSSGKERDRFAIYIEGSNDNLLKTSSPEEIYGLLQTQNRPIRFVVAQEDQNNLRARVDRILDEYHGSLATAQSQDDKLQIIVDMVAKLEKNHVFSDGNIRTLVMLVLNRELVKHGFTPVILDNPNQFDLFSTQELLAAVHRGMDVFMQCAHNSKTLYMRDRVEAQRGREAKSTPDQAPNPPSSGQNNNMM